MFCIKCGKEYLDGDRFCQYCGEKVIEVREYEKALGTEKTKSTAIIEDAEKAEKSEGAEPAGHAEKDENAEKGENAEKTEDAEQAKNAEQAGDVEKAEAAEKIENATAPKEPKQPPPAEPLRPALTSQGALSNPQAPYPHTPHTPPFAPPAFYAPRPAMIQRIDYRDYSKMPKGPLAVWIIMMVFSLGLLLFSMAGIQMLDARGGNWIPAVQTILTLLLTANVIVLLVSFSKKRSKFLLHFLSVTTVLAATLLVMLAVFLIMSALNGESGRSYYLFDNLLDNWSSELTLMILTGFGLWWLLYGLKSRRLRTFMGNSDYLEELPLFKKTKRPQSLKPELDEERQRSKTHLFLRVIAVALAGVLVASSALSAVHDSGRQGISSWQDKWYRMEWDPASYKFKQDERTAYYDLNQSDPWQLSGTSFEGSFNGSLGNPYNSSSDGKRFSDWATDEEKEQANSLYKQAESSWTVNTYKDCLSAYKSLYETVAARIEEDYADERTVAEEAAAEKKRTEEEAAAKAAEAERQKQERLSKAVQTPINASQTSGKDTCSVSGKAYVWPVRRGNDTSSVPYEFSGYYVGAKTLPSHSEYDLVIPFEVDLAVKGPESLFSSGSQYLSLTALSGSSSYMSSMRFNFYISNSGGWTAESSSRSIVWTSNSAFSTSSGSGQAQGYIVVANYYRESSTYTLPSSFSLQVKVGYYISETVMVKLPNVSR